MRVLEPGSSRSRAPIAARTALAALTVLFLWLAAAPAVVNSRIVLATVGGSPDWLLGLWRFAGAGALAGPDAGWTYYRVLLAACALYGVVVLLAPHLRLRTIWIAIAGLHALFLLAPPLLSQDVFSYIAYARLGVEHDLNPYTFRPFDIPADPVFGFAGSKDASSVYGPFFTLLSYPLALLPVSVAFWVLKAVTAGACLALVALIGDLAGRVGACPKRAIGLIGLCPATLVHVVAGAHNEALTMLIVIAGVSLTLRERPLGGGFAATLGAGVKASAMAPLPFMLAAQRDRGRMFAGMVAAALLTGLTAVVAFGADALNGLNLISSNQDRTSRFSLPQVTVDALGRVFGSLDHAAAIGMARALFGVLLVAAVAALLVRSWRRPETWIANAGWATFGVLLATAWLLPWYMLWLLPFTALARDRALTVATFAMSVYVMAIAIPF